MKSRCVFCKEMAHKTEEQLLADLPDVRLAPHTPPFYYPSCDYFGPYNVKIGRNKQMKHYGVIFTCLNTLAGDLINLLTYLLNKQRDIYLPEHASSAPRASGGLVNNGVHASLAEIFLH